MSVAKTSQLTSLAPSMSRMAKRPGGSLKTQPYSEEGKNSRAARSAAERRNKPFQALVKQHSIV
jgi:hypothetical protein